MNYTFSRAGRLTPCIVTLSLLAGCGGGGGRSSPPPPPPPPPTLSVGGSVSGLAGTLVLQQSGANNLNVTANGAFTFPGTVAQGGAYAVTILTQPAGQTCTVNAGSGTASANVTTVTVSCVSFYTIGGTVSGLTAGTVVLQNNAGNDLSVTANGAFAFTTVLASGTNYSVSVSDQPPGPDCTVTSGAGTTNADVTSVAVVCTPDASTLFLPHWVGDGNQLPELHVVTSKAPARAPIRVATNFLGSFGYVMQFGRDVNGKLVAGKPTTLVYGSGPFSDGRVYALELSAASALVPRQLGNLRRSDLGVFSCETSLAYEDVDDPASAFLLLGIPAGGVMSPCAAADFVRIRLSDSTTAAPVSLPNIPLSTKQFLYRPDGTFAGMVVCEYATHRLMMYHDATFTTATPLLDGCVNFRELRPKTVAQLSNLTADPSYTFLHVSMQDGTNKLYRVDHTRAISAALYDQLRDPFDGAAIDDQYLYFSDRTGLSPIVQAFLRVRLDGTTPAQSVYTYPIPGGDTALALSGEVGSKLVLTRTLMFDSMTSTRTADVRTVDKTGSVSATVIATYTDATAFVRVFGDVLFVNVTRRMPPPDVAFEIGFDTEILGIDGSVVEPRLADSSFTGEAAGHMLRFRESVSGGTRSTRVESLAVNPSLTLTSTLLKRRDGSDYALTGSWPHSSTFGFSPSIGAGYASGNMSTSLAFDLSRGMIESVVVPNKLVSLVGGY